MLFAVIAIGLYCFYSADAEESVCKYDIHIDIPKATSGIDHNPSPEHHDMKDATFDYPTVGIPKPGNKYNFTKVPKEKLK